LFAEAVGQQAVAADAHEAFGQHMQEEAAEEVDGIEGHHLLLAAVSIIALGEADAIPVECGKAVVGDGLEQPAAGFDQLCYFLPAQDLGQLLANSRIRKKLTELIPAQRLHIEESQRRDMVFYRSRTELALLEQIALVGANMIRAQLVR